MLADREMVEQNADSLLDGAAENDVAFLVVGDPLRSVFHAKSFCFQCYFVCISVLLLIQISYLEQWNAPSPIR